MQGGDPFLIGAVVIGTMLETLLVVYVDDFKMSGPAKHKAKLWADITGDPDHPERGGIYMGTPEQQKRFLGCDHTITEHVAADGTNVRRMEYNMEPFFRGCLQRWTDLTGQDWHNLPHANTPFLDDDALRKREGIGPLEFRLQPGAVNKSHGNKAASSRRNLLHTDPNLTEADKVPSGVLAPVAASSLMQTLYGARFARPDLLRAIAGLARKISKWRPMQDYQLHRLMCYIKSTLHFRQYAWCGDRKSDLRLHLYTDADLAGDPEDSVSTSGAYFAVVGPHAHVPLAQRCKKQGAVSHSSTEAELISADMGLKSIGLPALDLWEVILAQTWLISPRACPCSRTTTLAAAFAAPARTLICSTLAALTASRWPGCMTP